MQCFPAVGEHCTLKWDPDGDWSCLLTSFKPDHIYGVRCHDEEGNVFRTFLTVIKSESIVRNCRDDLLEIFKRP